MDEILNIIIKLVATLLALGLTALGKKVYSYIKSKLDAEKWAALERFVTELVAAAEQMYKAEDEDGSIRLDYVQGMLIEAGYDMTDAVRALIESKVFQINQRN